MLEYPGRGLIQADTAEELRATDPWFTGRPHAVGHQFSGPVQRDGADAASGRWGDLRATTQHHGASHRAMDIANVIPLRGHQGDPLVEGNHACTVMTMVADTGCVVGPGSASTLAVMVAVPRGPGAFRFAICGFPGETVTATMVGADDAHEVGPPTTWDEPLIGSVHWTLSVPRPGCIDPVCCAIAVTSAAVQAAKHQGRKPPTSGSRRRRSISATEPYRRHQRMAEAAARLLRAVGVTSCRSPAAIQADPGRACSHCRRRVIPDQVFRRRLLGAIPGRRAAGTPRWDWKEPRDATAAKFQGAGTARFQAGAAADSPAAKRDRR
jgi:hypothetical protein